MWHFEHTESTTATAEQIWALYAEPTRWPEWDAGLTRVTIEGAFAAGTTGTIKPAGGPALRYVLAEVTPLRSFADVTKLPLAGVRFTHEITPTPAGHDVTQRVDFEGPLRWLFAKLMGRSLTADMPETMRRLLRLAESSLAASA